MIKYNINKDKNRLDVKWVGDITQEEIKKYLIDIYNEGVYDNINKTLIDGRQSNLLINDTDFVEEINILRNKLLLDILSKIDENKIFYIAIIIDKPIGTALSTFYSMISESRNFIFRVFSTDDAAEEWLKKY